MSKNTKPRDTASPPLKASDLGHFRLLRQCRARLGLGKRTAQSPELRLVYVRGVDVTILLLATIQIYLALIGSLLLQLQLGRRPSKRVWETMQWHQCGMISDEELKEVLVRELASEKRRRESKTREAFWKKS